MATPLPKNVERLPSGNLRIAVRAGGRKHHVTIPGTSTRQEIEMARARLVLDVGTVTAQRAPTMRTLIAELHARWEGGRNTLIDRERVVRDFIPDDILDLPVDRVTSVHIDTLYAQLAGRDVSANRIGRVADVIGTALGRAATLGLIPFNPALNVPRPRIERPDITPPSDDELEAIIRSLPFGWLAVGVDLACTTGARRGEVAGLRWDAIVYDDTGGGIISIQRAVADTDLGVIVKDTKTGKRGRRKVAVDAETVAMLRAWHATLAARALARGVPMTEWVFPNEQWTGPRRADSFTQAWTKHLAARPELTPVRLHDLRHYVATKLVAARVPISFVSRRLGHSTTQVTQDIYTSFLPADDADATQVISIAMRGRRKAAPGAF